MLTFAHFILFMISSVLLASILVSFTYGLNNGLGRTPQMGKINES